MTAPAPDRTYNGWTIVRTDALQRRAVVKLEMLDRGSGQRRKPGRSVVQGMRMLDAAKPACRRQGAVARP